MISIKELMDEYKPNNDLFTEEDYQINKLKNIIYNDLNEVDKRIILMYAESGSLRQLGKEIGVCASTALNKINEIRNKIYDKYNNNTNPDTNNNS